MVAEALFCMGYISCCMKLTTELYVVAVLRLH